jgi:hypothetical protein
MDFIPVYMDIALLGGFKLGSDAVPSGLKRILRKVEWGLQSQAHSQL